MKYRALMLDVDGTLIKYDYAASPTKRVITAVKKAQEKVTVCLVTGRSIQSARIIAKELGLTKGFAAVDSGAIVINLETNELIYEQLIEKEDLHEIIKILTKEKVNFYLKDKKYRNQTKEEYIQFKNEDDPKDVTMIFTGEDFTLEETHRILKKLTSPNIAVARGRHDNPDKYSFQITHAKATKLHGISVISEKLNLKHAEIIGVGDGYNDFPLLMASGLKVAMGNAIDDLKEIADYISPSVDDDGIADVVEKYILK